jgi:hypothetical protein
MPRLFALLLLVIAGLAIGSLVSGSILAEIVLPGGLPFGNVLAAVGLCSLAGAAFLLGPRASARRRFSRTVLLASLLWLPLSISLAGNVALNFSGARGAVWLAISSATTIAALGSLTWAVAGLLFNLRGKAREA